MSHRVPNFLLTYRTTPHATTGKSPSQLLLKRDIKTSFDLLKPDCKLEKQSQQKSSHDRRHARSQWFVGQRVMARNLRPGPDWVPATILEVKGPVTYLVETDDKQVWKRHLDQFKQKSQSTEFENDDTEFPSIPTQNSTRPEDPPDTGPDVNTGDDTPDLSVEPQAPDTTTPRYPSRNRHGPNRYVLLRII